MTFYRDFFPPSSSDIFIFFLDSGNETGEQSRTEEICFFPFQNVATAAPDSWASGSPWFVQNNFILPEESLGDVALAFRGRSSFVHLPLFRLTEAYNTDEFQPHFCAHMLLLHERL